MDEREIGKSPILDPKYAFLENGDEQYTPLIQIRVAVDGRVFLRNGNMAEILEYVTREDVDALISKRGQGEYQQYDYYLIAMNTDNAYLAKRNEDR